MAGEEKISFPGNERTVENIEWNNCLSMVSNWPETIRMTTITIILN